MTESAGVPAVATATPASSGFDLWTALPWAVAGLLVIAVVALLVLWLRALDQARDLRQSAADARRSAQPRSTAPPATVPTGTTASTVDAADPRVLRELVTLADLTTSPAANAQLARVMRLYGLSEVAAAVGDPVDFDLHNVSSAVDTRIPARADTIAAVIRPGWALDVTVLRPADVQVWKLAPSSPTATTGA